jgi:hypothetical protein
VWAGCAPLSPRTAGAGLVVLTLDVVAVLGGAQSVDVPVNAGWPEGVDDVPCPVERLQKLCGVGVVLASHVVPDLLQPLQPSRGAGVPAGGFRALAAAMPGDTIAATGCPRSMITTVCRVARGCRTSCRNRMRASLTESSMGFGAGILARAAMSSA